MKSLNKPAVFYFSFYQGGRRYQKIKETVFSVRFLVSVIRASGITLTHVSQEDPLSLWRDRAQILPSI